MQLKVNDIPLLAYTNIRRLAVAPPLASKKQTFVCINKILTITMRWAVYTKDHWYVFKFENEQKYQTIPL